MYLRVKILIRMKKETGILLATSVGFFSILGVYVYKKLSKAKEMDEKRKNWQKKLHRDYKKRYRHEDQEGVEFLNQL